MFHKLFKITPFVILTLLNVNVLSAHASGGVSGGGGDAVTESRIDAIRADILSWINRGGARGLTLPSTANYQNYEEGMIRVLLPHAVVIGSVTSDEERKAEETGDDEHQVKVDGDYKTCRGFKSKKDSFLHILCNVERFSNTPEAQQYQLIHHEYAGLAGLENNVGASSDYEISNQVTSFLKLETVLKLSVKNSVPAFGAFAQCDQLLDGNVFGSASRQLDYMKLSAIKGNTGNGQAPYTFYYYYRFSGETPIYLAGTGQEPNNIGSARRTQKVTYDGLGGWTEQNLWSAPAPSFFDWWKEQEIVAFEEKVNVRFDATTKRISIQKTRREKQYGKSWTTNVEFSALLQCDQ